MNRTLINPPTEKTPSLHLTASQLKTRGFTDALIRDFLGPTDQTRTNPHYRGGPPMRLYRLEREEAAEGSAAWESRADATRRRKEGAACAVETKRTQLRSHLEAVEITVPLLDEDELTQLACDHFNGRLYARGDFDGREATPSSDAAFLARITVNFLQHGLSAYDAELGQIFGAVGVRYGHREINRKAYAAIAMACPTLAEECQRQLDRKFGDQQAQAARVQ